MTGTKTNSAVSSAVNYSLDATGNPSSDGLRSFAYDSTNLSPSPDFITCMLLRFIAGQSEPLQIAMLQASRYNSRNFQLSYFYLPIKKVSMADLIRVKDKFQITIPVSLRKAVDVHMGDYLEVTAVDGGILLRPKKMVDTLASVSPANKTGILAFLNEPRTQVRARSEIDADIASDRASWGP